MFYHVFSRYLLIPCGQLTARYLLLDMRDRKGWKALGYESFVEYGEKELNLGAARIYQLADAAEISLQIGFSTKVENQPKETHLRPLKQVPEEVRREIWAEATRKAEEENAQRKTRPLLTGLFW